MIKSSWFKAVYRDYRKPAEIMVVVFDGISLRGPCSVQSAISSGVCSLLCQPALVEGFALNMMMMLRRRRRRIVNSTTIMIMIAVIIVVTININSYKPIITRIQITSTVTRRRCNKTTQHYPTTPSKSKPD